MVFLRIRKLVVACWWKSGPDSCQEARQQADGSAWKRAGPEPSVKSPVRGSDDAIRSMTRNLRRPLLIRVPCQTLRGV